MRPIPRAFILFVLAFSIYTAPLTFNALVTPFFHTLPSQDVVSATLLPASILSRGDFFLDQFRRFITNNFPEPYFVNDQTTHLVSRYPVMAGVLAVPFAGAGYGTRWIARTLHLYEIGKLSAAFITALTIVIFFFAARALTNRATAVMVTLAFAFGTGVWTTASQGLWQHTPSILFQTIAFWFLLRGFAQGAPAVAPAGLFLAWATIARPPVAIVAILFAGFVVIFFRPALLRFLVWTLPPVIFAFSYNTIINGSPFVFGYQEGAGQFFSFPRWEAILGLLFSSGRGLFIYSPFLLLAPLGLWQGMKSPRKFFYLALAISFVGYTGIMAAWGSLGGWAYGARMLTDTLPAMCLLIIPAVEQLHGAPRAGLWIVIGLSCVLASLGVWDYGLRFHSDPANSVWSLENSEPVFYLRLYLVMIQETLGW
jgi:hypothetical protein